MDSHGLTLDAPVGGLCFRRDDNVWAAEGEGRSRFPEGMTERKARARNTRTVARSLAGTWGWAAESGEKFGGVDGGNGLEEGCW